MKIGFYKFNFKLKKEYDQIKILFWCHFIFTFLSILLEFKHESFSTFNFIKFIFIVILYRLLYQIIEKLYYTYWAFFLFLIIYLSIGLTKSIFTLNIPGATPTYFLAILFLSIQAYMLSSPIYFPLIRWWEYDFRYRNDIKANVQYNESSFEGRLTDLRRGAGCVVLFENLNVGEYFEITVISNKKELALKAEIMSKREYSIARGYTYGVKFHFARDGEKNNFAKLCHLWNQERTSKLKMKFKNNRTS